MLGFSPKKRTIPAMLSLMSLPYLKGGVIICQNLIGFATAKNTSKPKCSRDGMARFGSKALIIAPIPASPRRQSYWLT